LIVPITDQAAYPDAPGSGKTAAKQTADGPGFQLFGKDGFTFGDFIDIINPLQHIPIVSTVYRQITGDGLDPGSRIGGGALFGGPIGLVASLVNVLDVEATGKDIGEQVVALFDDGAPSQTAELAPPVSSESAVPAGAPIWTNPDATTPPDAITLASFSPAGGGEVSKETEKASPVREDINVLLWARRETAFRQRAQAAEAAIEETKIARRVAAMRTSGTQIAALTGSLGLSPGDQAAAGAETPPRQSTEPGAVAPLGGWFSDVMLSALSKYQAASALKDGGLPGAGQAQKPE
jgi:hypothetical protein